MSRTVLGAPHATLASVAKPLTGAPEDFDGVIQLAEDRHYILIGEASHGTHEFYRIRAEITKRLIRAHTVAADGVIHAAEAELLRAIADALDCPIPPFLKGI